jgi:ribosomal protein S18 acetylase RimI-like enzyme
MRRTGFQNVMSRICGRRNLKMLIVSISVEVFIVNKNYIIKKLSEEDIFEIIIEHYYKQECFNYPNVRGVIKGTPDEDLRLIAVFSKFIDENLDFDIEFLEVDDVFEFTIYFNLGAVTNGEIYGFDEIYRFNLSIDILEKFHKELLNFFNRTYKIHRPTAEEEKQALDLALRVFTEYEMPEYEPEALENFKSVLEINNAFVASENGKIIGMINERGGGHVSMLFVDGDYHRNGIATALMNHIADDLKSKDIKQITVNSSPFGIPFYKNYGFTATDEIKRKDGFIYLPMSYKIK